MQAYKPKTARRETKQGGGVAPKIDQIVSNICLGHGYVCTVHIAGVPKDWQGRDLRRCTTVEEERQNPTQNLFYELHERTCNRLSCKGTSCWKSSHQDFQSSMKPGYGLKGT